jgi:hypothetical protein
MELADATSHLALAYVATVSDNGHRLSAAEFKAYTRNPERVRTTTAPWTSSILEISQTLAQSFDTDRPLLRTHFM